MSTSSNAIGDPEAHRPLTARSVIASVLLGTDPPVLPVQLLVRTTELFGISEGATRVALSRMVSAGELTTEDGRYRLAGHLVERQRRQSASRRPELLAWDGSWHIGVVPRSTRPAGERAELRQRMHALRLAELREGVWTRPANLRIDALPTECEWWSSFPRSEPPVHLWDLPGWSATAARLRGEMAAGVAALGPAFVLAASVLRHLQADPLLPQELLPSGWPGAELREEYEQFEADFRARLADWFRSL